MSEFRGTAARASYFRDFVEFAKISKNKMHVKLSCPTVKAYYKDSLKRTEATFCSNKEKKPLFWPQESK